MRGLWWYFNGFCCIESPTIPRELARKGNFWRMRRTEGNFRNMIEKVLTAGCTKSAAIRWESLQTAQALLPCPHLHRLFLCSLKCPRPIFPGCSIIAQMWSLIHKSPATSLFSEICKSQRNKTVKQQMRKSKHRSAGFQADPDKETPWVPGQGWGHLLGHAHCLQLPATHELLLPTRLCLGAVAEKAEGAALLQLPGRARTPSRSAVPRTIHREGKLPG